MPDLQLFEVKGAVIKAVQVALKRPTKKGDVVWSAQPQGAQFVGSVYIAHLDLTVTGEPCDDKKSAEVSAGQAALPQLTDGCGRAQLQPKGFKGSGKGAPAMVMPGKGVVVPPPGKGFWEGGKGVAVSASQTVTKHKLCRHFLKGGSCPMDAQCGFAHGEWEIGKTVVAPQAGMKRPWSPGPGADGAQYPPTKWAKVSAPPAQTQAEKESCLAEYTRWRDERLETGVDPEAANAQSFECWYAQVCLVCLSPVSGLANWPMHAAGSKHLNKYKLVGGVGLKPGFMRPEVHLKEMPTIPRQLSMFQQKQAASAGTLETNALGADMQEFISVAGFANGTRVLSIGEQDYSFSLSVARLQQQAGQEVKLVASSYLAEHDPAEPEVHVADDGARSAYSRRSLPSMNGALFTNLNAITALGGTNLHSVDATDLPGTLLTQLSVGEFDIVVFPFPRFSLKRSVDPGNSQLLRGFFRSVNKAGVLASGGVAQLILLGTQYAEWDTACMALEAGFELVSFVTLPPGFYQSREMTGKAWTPQNGILYSFRLVAAEANESIERNPLAYLSGTGTHSGSHTVHA